MIVEFIPREKKYPKKITLDQAKTGHLIEFGSDPIKGLVTVYTESGLIHLLLKTGHTAIYNALKDRPAIDYGPLEDAHIHPTDGWTFNINPKDESKLTTLDTLQVLDVFKLSSGRTGIKLSHICDGKLTINVEGETLSRFGDELVEHLGAIKL